MLNGKFGAAFPIHAIIIFHYPDMLTLFSLQVTHLIAGQVGTTKYHVARRLNLPILLPSWVEQSWDHTLSSSHLAATEKSILGRHLCLPFTGCTVSVTGLDETARKRVKATCEENGGHYSGELTKGVCTHLLVGSKTSELVGGGLATPTICLASQK